MVSFFGLRFGSDKKKLQEKQQEAEKSAKKWKKGALKSIDSDLSFGHDFPPPKRPSLRPGSSHSNRSTRLFRAPFANAEATSSMVDLAPPSARKASIASLRQAASSSNLKGGRPHISGPLGPPVTLPLGAEPGASSRPGTAGSTKKEWINPLDVHFGKDLSGARPHTSAGPSSAKSPLSHFEFDIGAPNNKTGSLDQGLGSDIGLNGYPSPPTSEKSLDHSLTRVNTEPKPPVLSKPPAPSSLRRVNTAETLGVPSPAASENQFESLERLDAPVIRNVIAKRETMTFHSPRRRSFSKQVDEGVNKRDQPKRTPEELAEIKRKRQTEGFEGNFSAFNFGPSSIDTSVPLPTPTDSPISPFTTNGTSGGPESPVETRRTSSPREGRKTAGERGMSVPMTQADVDGDQTIGYELTMSQSTPGKVFHPMDTDSARATSFSVASSAQSQSHGADSSSQHQRPRVDSDTLCPDTPTSLRAPPPPASNVNTARMVSPQTTMSSSSSLRLEETPPPTLNPDRRSQSPLRSRPQMEGDFPTSKGLPRGRIRAESSSISPDPSLDRLGQPSPLSMNPDRRSQAPLAARQPTAGDFPVSKGLPRGRRPGPGAAPITPVSVYENIPPPPRPPRESEGVTSLPGWADRAEKHMSAIPAPLGGFGGDSNHWAASKSSTGAPTLAPPRLPSPTFSSLEESLTENLSKTFDLTSSPAADEGNSLPMISPVLSEFGVRRDGRDSPMRVEAKKAPPRPLTLHSNGPTPNGSMKSPVGESSPGFI